VVIAIVGVLVATLLPALSKARDHARQLRCAMCLRSHGIAIANFAAEHNGALPIASYPTGWPNGGAGYTYTGLYYIGQMPTWNSGTEKATDDPAYEYEWGNFLTGYLGLRGNARNNDGLFLNSKDEYLRCPNKETNIANNTGTMYTNYMMMPGNFSSLNWTGYPSRTFADYSFESQYRKKLDRVIDGDWGVVQSPAGTFRGPCVAMTDMMYKYSPATQSSATSIPSHELSSNHLVNGQLYGANYLQFNGSVAFAYRRDIGNLYWWGVARNYSVCNVIGFYNGDPGGQNPKTAYCPALADWW
jgi:type II secretory pathway pseudopilin PulG